MKKSDITVAIIIGFLIGCFALIVGNLMEITVPFNYFLPIISSLLALVGMKVISLFAQNFPIFLQLGRFLLVGVLNTFVDLMVLNILIWISGITQGLQYSAFKGISFLLATINSYFWNKYWTFGKVREAPSPKEFTKFLTVVGIGFLLNVGIASFVVNVIGPRFGIGEKIWANIGALTATMVAWIWNFLGSKFIVFEE